MNRELNKVFGKTWYCFVDTNLATEDLKKAGIKVRKEMENKDYAPYKLKFCKIPANKKIAFRQIMRDLKMKMLLTEHLSYERVSETIFKNLNIA